MRLLQGEGLGRRRRLVAPMRSYVRCAMAPWCGGQPGEERAPGGPSGGVLAIRPAAERAPSRMNCRPPFRQPGRSSRSVWRTLQKGSYSRSRSSPTRHCSSTFPQCHGALTCTSMTFDDIAKRLSMSRSTFAIGSERGATGCTASGPAGLSLHCSPAPVCHFVPMGMVGARWVRIGAIFELPSDLVQPGSAAGT